MSQQINLYNPLFETKSNPFSARSMAQALGLVVAALALVSAYALIQTRSAERTALQLDEQLRAQRDQLAGLSRLPLRTPSKALEAEVAKLEAEVNARQTSLQALATGELGNTAGFSEFFAALGRQAVPGVWLTNVTIRDSGQELLVQGRALRADLMPAFLRGLSKEPIMRGRRVTELKLTARAGEKGKEDAAGHIEFSLTAPLQVAEAVPQ